jgi:hypothetical protein
MGPDFGKIGNAVLTAITSQFVRGDRNLIVLRIVLDVSENKPQVTLDLISYGEIIEVAKRTWRLALSDFDQEGASTTGRSTEPNLPLQVKEGLRAGLVAMDPSGDLPVWVNLVSPYGSLGVVPWERLLGTVFGRPVLRLPDFLERPKENTNVLEAAIIFDPPEETPAEKAFDQLKLIVDQILTASSRTQTRVHVFTTSVWKPKLSNVSTDNRVRLYPPEEAAGLAQSLGLPAEKTSGRRLWLEWICAAAEKRTIDSMHFVGRAIVAGARRGLLVSSAPVPDSGPGRLSLVDTDDIAMSLMRVGAWAAIFSPPSGGSNEPAMSFVADAFARSWPGVALYHRARPEDRDELGRCFKFMFASSAARPPKMANGFTYCQPGAVAVHANFQGHLGFDPLVRSTELVGKGATLAERAQALAASYIPGISAPDIKQAPNWASATQRYIESASLEHLHLKSVDVLFDKATATAASPVTDVQSKVLNDTLSDIQSIAAKYLRDPNFV